MRKGAIIAVCRECAAGLARKRRDIIALDFFFREVHVRRAIFVVFLSLCLLVPACCTAWQQDANDPDAAEPAAQRRGRGVEPPPPLPGPTAEQSKALNKARYAKLKNDTDQLLKLATELKESVDKANPNTLSVDVIKKTEQIEKLAKSVREKMKNY